VKTQKHIHIAVIVDTMQEFENWKRNIAHQIDIFQSPLLQQSIYTNASEDVEYVPIIRPDSAVGHSFDGMVVLRPEQDNTRKIDMITPIGY
jgi:hypothetical protein